VVITSKHIAFIPSLMKVLHCLQNYGDMLKITTMNMEDILPDPKNKLTDHDTWNAIVAIQEQKC